MFSFVYVYCIYLDVLVCSIFNFNNIYFIFIMLIAVNTIHLEYFLTEEYYFH
jgi:hypothetical protein